jgi:hypothetical protein
LVLLEEPVTYDIAFKLRMLILNELPLNQAILAGSTDRHSRGPSKPTAAFAAEAARADAAMADTLSATSPCVAPITNPT